MLVVELLPANMKRCPNPEAGVPELLMIERNVVTVLEVVAVSCVEVKRPSPPMRRRSVSAEAEYTVEKTMSLVRAAVDATCQTAEIVAASL